MERVGGQIRLRFARVFANHLVWYGFVVVHVGRDAGLLEDFCALGSEVLKFVLHRLFVLLFFLERFLAL